MYQKLSEKFIEKHIDKVNWFNIMAYQKLSEKFIEKHNDKVDLDYISKYQKLSEKFIEKNIDKVNWDYISKYQWLSEEFIEKNKIKKLHNNWIYDTIEEKEDFIQKNTQYKILQDKKGKFIIAYKAIRDDNYSLYNFQFKYEVGKIYESHCDCNLDEESSFGLSAWTYEEAISYGRKYINYKIIKVKIYINDIGAIIKNNKKIRCFKFEVVE